MIVPPTSGLHLFWIDYYVDGAGIYPMRRSPALAPVRHNCWNSGPHMVMRWEQRLAHGRSNWVTPTWLYAGCLRHSILRNEFFLTQMADTYKAVTQIQGPKLMGYHQYSACNPTSDRQVPAWGSPWKQLCSAAPRKYCKWAQLGVMAILYKDIPGIFERPDRIECLGPFAISPWSG